MAKRKVRKTKIDWDSKEVAVTLQSEFYRIALDNLATAIEIQRRLEGKTEAELWKSDKEFREKERQYHAILTSVVFSALTAEALINHYGITRLDKADFDRLEKLTPESKWIVIPKLERGISLDPGRQPFQGLHKLMTLRNTLVHFKSFNRPLTEAWKARYRAVSVEDADGAAMTVNRLAKWLHENDPDFELGEMIAPSERFEGMDFLEAYKRVLGKRPR